MSSNNKATLAQGESSKWSNIKDFYENFKDELSASDFADSEDEDALETFEIVNQEEYSAEPWQTLGTEVVWVEGFEDDDEVVFIEEDNELGEDVLETTTKNITRNPRKRKNQVSESSTPKPLKSSSKVLNARNKATPSRKIKKAETDLFDFVYPPSKPVPMPEYEYTCPKCHKGSNKPNFLDSHTEAQCERALSTRDRQNTVKKTFSY